jgi:hypothetical protein
MNDEPSSTAEELCCPTCGARQAWSDTCRRCKCDLSLVLQLRQHLRRLRRQCLSDLRDDRLAQALATARQCYGTSGEDEDARLLAVCHLLNGQFAEALAVGSPSSP